jgi:hypothetical protein
MHMIINTFAKRLPLESRFSSIKPASPAPVTPEGCFSGALELTNGKLLFGKLKARRGGKSPRKVVVTGPHDKQPAERVKQCAVNTLKIIR